MLRYSSAALGYNNFGFGIRVVDQMRARGLQRSVMSGTARVGKIKSFGNVGIVTYGLPLFMDRRDQRQAGLRYFGVGRMGEETQPWYESVFGHIERFSASMAPYVLQILNMSFDQQRAGWANMSQKEREAAYLGMIRDLSAQKTGGTSKYSSQQVTWLREQFARESTSTQRAVIDQASGGDPTAKASLLAMFGLQGSGSMLPWLILGGVGVAGVLVLAFRR